MKGEITPASQWPIKRRIILLDAWMRNPIEVRVTKHWNDTHIGAEDDRGIVYFSRTDRIIGFASAPASVFDEFDDLLA